MASPKLIEILIEYQLAGEADWREVRLEPDEFFWRDPENAGEDWDVESASAHENAVEYLPPPHDHIRRVREVVEDRDTGARQTRFFDLWGGPENYSCLVTTEHPGETKRTELIHVADLPFLENASQVIRWNVYRGEPTLCVNEIRHGGDGDEQTIDLLGRTES